MSSSSASMSSSSSASSASEDIDVKLLAELASLDPALAAEMKAVPLKSMSPEELLTTAVDAKSGQPPIAYQVSAAGGTIEIQTGLLSGNAYPIAEKTVPVAAMTQWTSTAALAVTSGTGSSATTTSLEQYLQTHLAKTSNVAIQMGPDDKHILLKSVFLTPVFISNDLKPVTYYATWCRPPGSGNKHQYLEVTPVKFTVNTTVIEVGRPRYLKLPNDQQKFVISAATKATPSAKAAQTLLEKKAPALAKKMEYTAFGLIVAGIFSRKTQPAAVASSPPAAKSAAPVTMTTEMMAKGRDMYAIAVYTFPNLRTGTDTKFSPSDTMVVVEDKIMKILRMKMLYLLKRPPTPSDFVIHCIPENTDPDNPNKPVSYLARKGIRDSKDSKDSKSNRNAYDLDDNDIQLKDILREKQNLSFSVYLTYSITVELKIAGQVRTYHIKELCGKTLLCDLLSEIDLKAEPDFKAASIDQSERGIVVLRKGNQSIDLKKLEEDEDGHNQIPYLQLTLDQFGLTGSFCLQAVSVEEYKCEQAAQSHAGAVVSPPSPSTLASLRRG